MRKIRGILLIIVLISPIFFNISVAEDEVNEIETISSEKYKDGYRYNSHGWIYLHIEGEPYERGYQHGYLLSEEIVDQINRLQNIFSRPGEWRIQNINALRLFWRKYPEEYKQEIRGIADGCAARGGKVNGKPVNYKDILTMNQMYEMRTRFRSSEAVKPFRIINNWLIGKLLKKIGTAFSKDKKEGHCSSFIATGDATKDGEIVASHLTYAYTKEGELGQDYWWHIYFAQRFNLMLDIKPASGHRMLISTSPGYIWSDEDYYQNDAGMILMETTFGPYGKWYGYGDPLVIRIRKAIQYSDNIDQMKDIILKKNNGLMPCEWIMGDTKTGEIATLQLALFNHAFKRTKNGMYWSVNQPVDDKVRWELNSILGFGIVGRLLEPKFEPNNRYLKFEEFKDEFCGKIDIDIAKQIMSTHPISKGMFDCKLTDSNLVEDNGIWGFMGYVDGHDFIAKDYPVDGKIPPGYTDLPACGWIQLFTLDESNVYRSTDKNFDKGEQGIVLFDYETSKNDLRKAIYSTPAKDENTIYVTSWNGNVSAIDIKSKNLLWETNIGWSSASSPIIDDEYLYVGSDKGLFSLNKITGEVNWNKKIGAISSKPAISKNKIFTGSHDGNIYSYNLEDGELDWTFETDGDIYSSPAIHENILYIGSNDGYIYAIDIKDKELIWKFKTDGPVVSTPLIVKDSLYFGSWDNNLYALDLEKGKLKWKFTTGWGVDSSPTYRDDTIYFGSEDNNFYAINAEDGKLKWIFPTNGGISSSPTVYGNFVFFGSSDGKIYALNATTGDLEWSNAPDYHIQGTFSYVTKPIVSSPYLDDGKVYIGSTNGKLYCYDAQTYEELTKDKKEIIEIPFETWFFLIITILLVALITVSYLSWSRRKNS